ncbi:uncharacterized protein SOCE26_052620 [Sorangium cellulosum]|uniref:Uncharacterized protein n=1 Tax=Sorangium cellulosum TaxID=56 RepID=A0A2L0EWX8_SORCE|nr:hypothetical protein [Sorangium cellulosum]AUX43807.1 uncharacterized protein SOCE26_052620 [Sorangium cellulosum]
MMPTCKTAQAFLTHHHGRGCLAPLTGQDRAAMATFVHAAELYGVGDDAGREAAIVAMRAAVGGMQPHTRWLAREAIAHVMEWGDRDGLWRVLFPAGAEGPSADAQRGGAR